MTKLAVSVSIAVLIALVVIAAVLWNTSDRLPLFQSYLKIIINHFHVMMIVTAVHYKFSEEVKYFERIQEVVSQSNDLIFNLQCIFNG